MVIFRSLGRKYAFISLLFLAFFGAYLVASFMFVHYISGDAHKITVAAGQRAFTLDIASHLHFITSNMTSATRDHHVRGAERAMDDYEAILLGLRDGNPRLNLLAVHPYDRPTRRQLDQLIELWEGTQRPLLRDILRTPERTPENCVRCHAAVRAKLPEVEAFVRSLERHHDAEISLFKAASIGTLGLLIAMMGLIFLFVRRTLIAPVKTLRRAAACIEGGNFECETDVRSHDEIGDLSRSFNQMARSLAALFREKSENLEQLSILNQVGQAASSSLSLERMLRQALGSLQRLKPFESAGVFLADEGGQTMRLTASLNFTPDHAQACALVSRGECVCGRCLERGEAVDFRDALRIPCARKPTAARPRTATSRSRCCPAAGSSACSRCISLRGRR